MKFDNRFRNLLEIKCTKHYSDSFRFDIFIARCLGINFFTIHSVHTLHNKGGQQYSGVFLAKQSTT